MLVCKIRPFDGEALNSATRRTGPNYKNGPVPELGVVNHWQTSATVLPPGFFFLQVL
jgi:hypothetical protein